MSDESQLVPLEQVAVAEAGAEGAVVQQQASSSGSAAENPLNVVAFNHRPSILGFRFPYGGVRRPPLAIDHRYFDNWI